MPIITVEQNVAYLKRCAALERACVRVLAGWLPGVPEWDAKNALGLHIWESADAAERLHGRLREQRCHHPERGLSGGLQHLVAELPHAQNTAQLISSVYGVVKRALLQAYRAHPEVAAPLFDHATAHLLHELAAVTERQVTWAESFLPTLRCYPDPQPWQGYIAELLAADGGVSGAETHIAAPKRRADHALLLPWQSCQRESGWPIFDPNVDAEPDQTVDPAAYREWRFKHYLNEMTAAETLGSIIWLTPEMPWQFHCNAARHLWDEVRHSQLGQTRIQQLGWRISDVPQVVQIYNVMMRLPAVEQYALLATVIEPNGMPEKVRNKKHWESLDDDLSAVAVTHDWSDENTHVRWGKQWTPVLLTTYNYAETPQQIAARMEAWLLEHTPVTMQKAMAQEAHT